MATLQVIDRDGVSHDVECKPGLKVMEVLRELDYGVAAICGGMCSCATCHIYVDRGVGRQTSAAHVRRARPADRTFALSRELAPVLPGRNHTGACPGSKSPLPKTNRPSPNRHRKLMFLHQLDVRVRHHRWRHRRLAHLAEPQQAAHAQERLLGRAPHRPVAQARLGSLQAARRGFLPRVSDAGGRRFTGGAASRRKVSTPTWSIHPKTAICATACTLHKSMQLVVPDMKELSRRLTDAAKEREGRYDGWSRQTGRRAPTSAAV